MKLRSYAITLSALVASGAASAAVDLTPVTDALADIAVVGTAVFGVYVAIHAIKWIRRAL